MRAVHPPLEEWLLDAWTRDFVALGVTELADRSAEKPRFLDIGCGLGRNMTVFSRLGFDVSGLDMNEEETAYVREKLGFVAYNEELRTFVRRGETYDCVLASHFIEHVPDLHAFFETVLPMVRDRGMLLVETPLASGHSLRQAERYRDIYHTLFFDHFTLGLAGAMHGVQAVTTRNISFFASSGSFNINMQVRYERTPADGTNLRTAARSGEPHAVRFARRVYDGLMTDALVWSRSHQVTAEASRFASLVSRIERSSRQNLRTGARVGRRLLRKVLESSQSREA